MSKSLLIRRAQITHVLSERKVLGCLRNRFVTTLKAAFQDAFFLHLVFEYVQGGELYHILAQNGAIPPSDARTYACEVVCALSFLHSQGVVYRDLKPENTLIAADGHIKLVDFGFAKVLQAGERTFTLCGTPEYLSPEVIASTGHSFECDWWALGVLLYEMTTGTAPFVGATPFILYENILTQEVKFPAYMPLATRSLIGALLVKDAGFRAKESEIRTHSYFAGIEWGDAAEGKLQVEYRPRVRNPMDTRNFEKYAEEDAVLDEKAPTDAEIFRDF